MPYNELTHRSYVATATAIAAGARVKLDSSNNISVASATESWIGVATEAIPASARGQVALNLGGGGRLTFLTSGNVALGGLLYQTASGCVDDDSTTGNFTGYQAIAAATSGDTVEAIPARLGVFSTSASQAAVATTGATNSSPYGFTTAAQADAIVTLVNALRTALINAQIIKGS